MVPKSKNVKLWDVAPRIAADFATVHAAMLLAFAISAVYQTYGESASVSNDVVASFRHYYFRWFLLLSPLFSVVFYLNGMYTHVRFFPDWDKWKRFAAVVFLSLAMFLAANVVLIPARNPLGRSVILLFGPLAICGLVGTRLAKEWLLGKDRKEQRTRHTKSEPGPVLVVGGAGYIGCHFVQRLLEQGNRVRILDNAVYGLDAIQSLLSHPRLEYQNGDCRNIQDIVKSMRGVSNVVHLAAIVGDPACELDRKTSVEINYAAIRLMVEIAKGYGIERFLFASSCSVYGATDDFMDENSKVEPISLYGETKEASERVLLQAAASDFHPVIMRFATVFGLSARPRFDLVVNLLTARARQEGTITIYNGQQWRPFIHVKDLAEAMILLLNAPLASVSRQVFNVGDTAMNHTLAEVAEVILDVLPKTRVEYVENADRRNYRVNFEKIEKRVGFHSSKSLMDGILEIKAAFDSNRIDSYKEGRFSNLVYLRESGTPENKSDLDGELMAAFGGEHIRRVLQETPKVDYSKAKAAAAT